MCCTTCEMLVLRPGIECAPPALQAGGLNHWTTREVPILLFYNHSYINVHWLLSLHLGYPSSLPFPNSMSFLQHSKHQTNNKLLFCACSYSLRLAAKLFISYQWDPGTFLIISDRVCKPGSFLSFPSYNESSRPC